MLDIKNIKKECYNQIPDDNEISGGKIIKMKNTLQDMINKDLLNIINMKDFIKEYIDPTNVKNTSGVVCSNCGSENLHVELKQTRSADEEATSIYKCLDCGQKSTYVIKINTKNKALINEIRNKNNKK